jgi:uncharacterized protein (DUF885 family)
VTPPEDDWDEGHKQDHLRMFNPTVMDVITIHEAYPGHYIQFLYADQFPTKTRKLVWCGSNVEGWAHYAEPMMVEDGYREGDEKIRLAQLQEALLRDCRYVVGIKMHTEGMSVEARRAILHRKRVHGTGQCVRRSAPGRIRCHLPDLHAREVAAVQTS